MPRFVPPPPPHSSAWEQYAPLAGSTVVHLALLGILAAIVFPAAGSPEPSTLVAEITTPGDESPLVTVDTLTSATERHDADQQPSAFAETILSRTADAPVDASPRSDLAQPLEISHAGLAGGALAEQVAPLATLTTGGTGNGNQSGTADGDSGREFFGLNVTEQKVVYVVDNSRSMNYPHPGPAKTRFGRVKMELLHSIGGMNPEQQFFMIFFNSEAVPMPAERLMEATPGSKQRYLQWMATLKADGMTEPEGALIMALSLRPDVIYFLTDGAFRYRAVPSVTAANTFGIRINTICFGDDRGEEMMKELARRNGGTYKFIPDTGPAGNPANAAGDTAVRLIKQLGK